MTPETPIPVSFDEPHRDPDGVQRTNHLRATASPLHAAFGAEAPQGNTCITCGDVALPLAVIAIDTVRDLALCEAADGGRETVEIALVAPVDVGDELLVHAGTAISHLSRASTNPNRADAEAQEESSRRCREPFVPAGAERLGGVGS